MNPDAQAESVTGKRVLYELPGTGAVMVRRDIAVESSDAGTLAIDSYFPPGVPIGVRPPAVVIVAGYPDAGMQRVLGCRFKEMAFTMSWARLIAASGIATFTYANREPGADLNLVLDYIQEHAGTLGVDASRIGLWASSGSVPVALSALFECSPVLKCAALCYGYMLDLGGTTAVAEAAARFGFATCAAASTDAVPRKIPLFIARAGQDQMPRLNETIDRFVAAALAANVPLTLVNHAAAPHAFDLFHPGETTREIVRGILDFLKLHLLAA